MWAQFHDATVAVSAADCRPGVLSIILSLSSSTKQFLLSPVTALLACILFSHLTSVNLTVELTDFQSQS